MTKDLTEQWKNGELEFGEYWCKVVGSPYVEQVMSDCMTDEDIVEILGKVPSYKEWQPFTDTYFNGLTTKEISELAKKSIRLTTQHCKDNEEIEILREQLDVKNGMVDSLIIENAKLKELLKECREVAEFTKTIVNKHKWFNEVITKIDEVLK